MKLLILILTLTASAAGTAQQRAPDAAAQENARKLEPAYQPQQLALAREITELTISPDGCRVAFAADISGAQEVWLVPTCRADEPASGAGGPAWPEQLSSLGELATELAFAPDGKSVLFASDRGGDERRDLYLVGTGGGIAEALTLSSASETDPDADGGASFSPDGSRIAYVADRTAPATSSSTVMTTSQTLSGVGFQLYVMKLAGREITQLTREAISLRRPVWSPDGRSIAVARSPDGQRGDLLLVDVESGASRLVASPGKEGMLVPEQFLPDGSAVLCRARNDAGFMQLALVSVKDGSVRLFGPGDWDVEQAAARVGRGIVYSRNEDGRSALYCIPPPRAGLPLTDGKPVKLFGPKGHIARFDVDSAGRNLAMLWGDSTRPSDVWMLDLKNGRKTAVTRALAGGVEPGKLAKAELITYAAPDGTEIHAFYIPPARPLLGSPPPIVVTPHGGPDLQTFDEFMGEWQALSQAGVAVLAPNYRGSSGYGKRFLDANNKDWGGKDLEDLRAGVRHLAARGLADEGRAGITGGSYGGYLTLMALATMPESWAAGVEAYGMPDLKLDFELSTERFLEWYKTEMGTPETDAALFAERSAITHLDKIRAPLLIFQGANDTNVPPAESELIYRKLLERHVPVGLVIYPDEGHGFTKRRNRADYYKRVVDFFVAKLGSRPGFNGSPDSEPRGGAAESKP